MRAGAKILLKVGWGAFLLLTSLYCLLAFLPYTYCALIKAPPYEWMPWFVQHHALLYWLAWAAALAGFWPQGKNRWHAALFAALAVPGVYLALRPFLPALQSDRSAYVASLLFLLPLIFTTAPDVRRYWLQRPQQESGQLPYSTAVLAAVLIALLFSLGSAVHGSIDGGKVAFHLGDAELTGWSVVSHVLLAIILFSALNIISLLAQRTKQPGRVRLLLVSLC